jgi:hypothetical protein
LAVATGHSEQNGTIGRHSARSGKQVILERPIRVTPEVAGVITPDGLKGRAAIAAGRSGAIPKSAIALSTVHS